MDKPLYRLKIPTAEEVTNYTQFKNGGGQAMQEFIKSDIRFFVAPIDIFDFPELTIYEQMVYLVLLSYSNPRESTAFPSYSTIAEKGRMSRMQAIRCVKSLVQKGLIIKEERFTMSSDKSIRRTSNIYHIASPKGGNSQLPRVVTHSYQGGNSQLPRVVTHSYQGSNSQLPEQIHFNNIDQIEMDKIDQDLRKHIEKLGLIRYAEAIIEVYDKRTVTKKVFFEVLERVADKIGQVRDVKNYLTRSLRNEAGKKRNPGLPKSMTSPPENVINEQEAKAKLELSERLLKQLYPTGEK